MSINFESGDLPELGHMEMNCDGCGSIEDFEGDFRECIEEAKEFGWKIIKGTDGEWEHYCPECAD